MDFVLLCFSLHWCFQSGEFHKCYCCRYGLGGPTNLTASFVNSLLRVLGIGLICFLYIKFLAGNRAYKRFKEVVWGVLFAINTVSCVICGSIVYGFNFIHADGMLLLITAFVSALLTIQIIMKQDFEVR